MDKPKQKPKKKKIVQITYPAPYTQSWTPDLQPALLKNKVNKVAGSASRLSPCPLPLGTCLTDDEKAIAIDYFLDEERDKNIVLVLSRRCKRPTVSPRAWSQQFPARQPDPTAPHLKYGVFRNRRGAPPRPFPPKIDTCQKTDRCKRFSSPAKQIKGKSGQVKPPRGLTKSSPISTPVKPVGKTNTEPPKFVPGNTENIYHSKELCFSKVSHLDIKPKTGSVTPSFCPRPSFKSMPRRGTLTPTKFRHSDSDEVL